MSTSSTTIDSYNKYAKAYSDYLNSPTNFWNTYLEAPAVEKLVRKDVTGKLLLDIGCGSGQSSNRWSILGATVTGVDLSDELLVLAMQNFPALHFIKGDVEALPFADNTYDIAVASLVLHYLQDLSRAFAEVYRVLKSNGRFIFSMNHPMFTAKEKASLEGKKVYVQTPYFHTNKHKWTMVDQDMVMESYHHTFSDIVNKLIASGFSLTQVVETQPVPEGQKINESEYAKTMLFPSFIVIEAKKY